MHRHIHDIQPVYMYKCVLYSAIKYIAICLVIELNIFIPTHIEGESCHIKELDRWKIPFICMLIGRVVFVEVGKCWVYSADLYICHTTAVTTYSVQSCFL